MKKSWFYVTNIVLFCLVLLLSLPIQSSAQDANSSTKLNRRKAITCALALGAYGSLGFAAGPLRTSITHWDEKNKTIELSEKEADVFSRLLKTYFQALPGVAVNTVIAKSLDYVNEFANKVNGIEKESPNYSKTVMQAHMVLIGKLMINALFPAIVGNAGMTKAVTENYLRNPVMMWIDVTVLAPLIEEFLFRLIPSKVFGSGWTPGLISSVVFAAGHNFVPNEGFSLTKIPINQFIGGMFCWYLMKEKGIDHALLAHSVNNNIYATALYFNDLFG